MVPNGSQMGPWRVLKGPWCSGGPLGGPRGAKGPPKGHLGRPLFHDFGRWKCSRYSVILTFSIFERFWREPDRQGHRHVFPWFSRAFHMNPWGEYAYKTKLILTIPFLGISAGGVFVMPKSEFWDLNCGHPRAQFWWFLLSFFQYFTFAKWMICWCCFWEVRKTRFWNSAF